MVMTEQVKPICPGCEINPTTGKPMDLCPVCQFDRNAIAEALRVPPEPDGLESENHAMARCLIDSCPGCRERFIRK